MQRIIPIILLIAIGYVFNKKQYLRQEAADDLKKFTLDFIIPSIIFLAFLDMEIKTEHYAIILSIFIMNLLLLLLGYIFSKLTGFEKALLPFYNSGFSFGILAIPMYGMLYGYENIGNIVVFGIGNELFLWLIYANMIDVTFSKRTVTLKRIAGIFRSPLLLSVVSGIALNLLGISEHITASPILSGIRETISMISGMSAPIVFIIVGYGLTLKKEFITTSLKIVLIRILSVALAAAAVWYVFLNGQQIDNIAYLIFLIVPPPYALAVFMSRHSRHREERLTSTALSINTLLAVTAYIFIVYLV